jgi:hypothetical protein
VGDGVFSDGNEYHWDYYNSFVIQPYLLSIMEVMGKRNRSYAWFAPNLDKISKRYAEIQETQAAPCVGWSKPLGAERLLRYLLYACPD